MLKKLYSEIHSCHICQNMNEEKALRKIEAINDYMDIFIISQALAEGQLRKTGVNFFTREGKLGNTGNNLEKFLNKFNRTVKPQTEIQLESGFSIPKADANLISVYNTEITQCFPGKSNKKGDRAPTVKEMKTCVKQGFLEKEIVIIKPKLLLLMGDKSRRAFYKHFLQDQRFDNLTEHIDGIVKSGKIPSARVQEFDFFVLPIQHASGANSKFHSMLQNESLIGMVRNLLKGGGDLEGFQLNS